MIKSPINPQQSTFYKFIYEAAAILILQWQWEHCINSLASTPSASSSLINIYLLPLRLNASINPELGCWCAPFRCQMKKVPPGLLAVLEWQKAVVITSGSVHPRGWRIMQSVRSHQTPAEPRQNRLTSDRPDISLIRQQVALQVRSCFQNGSHYNSWVGPLLRLSRPYHNALCEAYGWSTNESTFICTLTKSQRHLKVSLYTQHKNQLIIQSSRGQQSPRKTPLQGEQTWTKP